jgi:hypothetical protein
MERFLDYVGSVDTTGRPGTTETQVDATSRHRLISVHITDFGTHWCQLVHRRIQARLTLGANIFEQAYQHKAVSISTTWCKFMTAKELAASCPPWGGGVRSRFPGTPRTSSGTEECWEDGRRSVRKYGEVVDGSACSMVGWVWQQSSRMYFNIAGVGWKVECIKVWWGGGFHYSMLPVEGSKATVCTGICPRGSRA